MSLFLDIFILEGMGAGGKKQWARKQTNKRISYSDEEYKGK